ncbi:hypothetical protein WKW77_26335 [Variovorax ureilyticus]|uniref:Uncharacterized protein n=1 Tax=Variovorax ureilyticus TaxID=1836198 RepID=A0ABU8VMS5_9BURK
MSGKSLRVKAVARAQRVHRIDKPLVIDTARAVDPATGLELHRYRIVSADDANDAVTTLLLDARGAAQENSDEALLLFPAASSRVLMGGNGSAPGPLYIGILEITSTKESRVTAVYTASEGNDGSPAAMVRATTRRVVLFQ